MTTTVVGAEVDERKKEERSFAEWSSRLLDLRGVAPIPRFGGSEAEWEDFRFKFTTSMALLGLDTLLEQAAREPGPLNIDLMDFALASRSFGDRAPRLAQERLRGVEATGGGVLPGSTQPHCGIACRPTVAQVGPGTSLHGAVDD
eukprot:916215-Heterocapsa_arctica.AAC.1